jgi:signal transduction histidine kinase
MEKYKAFFDIDMIKTVIRNLVNNAAKFSKEGGEVRISVLEKGDKLLVTIADNGVGINKENLDLLFAHGLYFSTKGTKQEKGSGLGLTLCKEFVNRNNGTI